MQHLGTQTQYLSTSTRYKALSLEKFCAIAWVIVSPNFIRYHAARAIGFQIPSTAEGVDWCSQ